MPNNLTIDQVMTALAEGPAGIGALAARLTLAQIDTPPAPGEWSFAEVFAHLRATADAWGDAIQGALSATPPPVTRVGREALAWMKGAGYVDQEFAASLAAYAARRSELLPMLDRLTPVDWTRSATVRRAGKLRQETVLSFAQRLAGHELRHRQELERLVTNLTGTPPSGPRRAPEACA